MDKLSQHLMSKGRIGRDLLVRFSQELETYFDDRVDISRKPPLTYKGIYPTEIEVTSRPSMRKDDAFWLQVQSNMPTDGLEEDLGFHRKVFFKNTTFTKDMLLAIAERAGLTEEPDAKRRREEKPSPGHYLLQETQTHDQINQTVRIDYKLGVDHTDRIKLFAATKMLMGDHERTARSYAGRT